MPKKRFSAEQIDTLLRQIEVTMRQGKSTQIACRDAGISEQTSIRYFSKIRPIGIYSKSKNRKQQMRFRVRLRSNFMLVTPLGNDHD